MYRTTALTLDPNHLAIMLIVPLLVLFPIYLRLERGHPWRLPLALTLGFLAVVELSTLSRSGLLGIAVGLAVLAIPYRHLLLKPRFLIPLGLLAAVVGFIVVQRSGFFQTVFEARTQSGGSSTRAHLEFYTLLRPAFEQHPFFGLGLNSFSQYYELQTGRTNWGPHSYYVAALTETGIVGTALFGLYLGYLFQRLAVLRRVGRRLALAGDRSAARVRPLALGARGRARGDARRQRLLLDHADVLLLPLRGLHPGRADRLLPQSLMRIALLDPTELHAALRPRARRGAGPARARRAPACRAWASVARAPGERLPPA